MRFFMIDSTGAVSGQMPHYSTPRGIHMTRLIGLLLIGGTLVLAGCNTMAGAGQDISKGGNAITNSAEKHE
jgi:predicted small secreted protein